MRSTDDQLREILERADHIKDRKTVQRAAVSYAISVCVCLLLAVVVLVRLPAVTNSGAMDASTQYGSLLLSASHMGYVVIGVLAFLLGIFLTLLCWQLRKLKTKEREST